MDANVILITCAIVMVINIFMAYRNSWVFYQRNKLNRFEGGAHVIHQYVDYSTMMNKFWVWDIEKLKVSNVQIEARPASGASLSNAGLGDELPRKD